MAGPASATPPTPSRVTGDRPERARGPSTRRPPHLLLPCPGRDDFAEGLSLQHGGDLRGWPTVAVTTPVCCWWLQDRRRGTRRSQGPSAASSLRSAEAGAVGAVRGCGSLAAPACHVASAVPRSEHSAVPHGRGHPRVSPSRSPPPSPAAPKITPSL